MAVKHRDIGEDGRPTREDWRRTPGFEHYGDTPEELRERHRLAEKRPAGGGKARGERIPWYYGAALLLFGVPFWPVAAWFLAAGWAVVVNAILDFVRLPWAVPAPSGVYGLVAALIVGGIYSRVELKPPIVERDWRRAALLWVVWALVMLSDVGATYRGLERPSILGVALAVVLTFGPDQAIMRGWRILRGRQPF